MQILFDTLRNHGHLFSLALWERVFESVLFRIFDYVRHAIDPSMENSSGEDGDGEIAEFDQDSWLYETCTMSLELIVDLFIKFYSTVNPLLKKVLMLLVSFIKRPHQSLAGIGIAAFVRLISNAGDLFSDEKWLDVVSSLKEAATSTLPDFSFIFDGDSLVKSNEETPGREGPSEATSSDAPDQDSESLRTEQFYAAISDVKCRSAVQLLLIQAIMEIYTMYKTKISTQDVHLLYDALHTVASHAHKINTDAILCLKLQELGSITQMQDPPLLRLENESYQMCLSLLQNLMLDTPPSLEVQVESSLVEVCQEILQFYIEASSGSSTEGEAGRTCHPSIPLGSRRRRELTTRAPLIVATLQAICRLAETSFEKNLGTFFPLISSLITCEHGSKDIQVALSDMLSVSIGPVLLRSC